MLDGRHTGTGGGNHVVLGGPTPADSPFLRRPDLLRSLVGYWHQPPVAVVPVLGPVRRPDQPGAARRRGPAGRRIYELEIAFRQIDAGHGGRDAAVARRPHLPQPAGRRRPATRTAPSSASTSCSTPTPPAGRQGLLELRVVRDAAARAHEPGAAAAAARAGRDVLAAALRPARWCAGARRCTTASCCRTSLRRISATCSTSCARAGYPFEPEWFAPHFEFRFPVYGAVDARGRRAASCARRSSRGTCWARKRAGRRHGALRRFVGRARAGARCAG